MGVLLSCQNLGKAYSAKNLFDSLSLTVSDGDRIGIIGPNGAGKSTLLRIMAGQERPDHGIVSARRHLKVGFVEQDPHWDDKRTVLQTLTDLALKAGLTTDTAEVEAQVVADRLGFSEPGAVLGTLSGGWKKRLAIAGAVLGAPDLVFLDEPTNHLDIQGVLWLEQLLRDAAFAWVLISHDRFFMDRVCGKVCEINRAYPDGVLTGHGGYQDFLATRNAWFEAESKRQESLANVVRRESAWLAAGVKARGTKARARISQAEAYIADLNASRGRLRQQGVQLDFAASGRKTKRLIVAEAICMAVGERPLIENLDLVLTPGLRLGIIGPNGSGKTTLLRLLLKLETPTSGSVVHADDLRLVYFDQNRQQLDPEATLKGMLSHGHDSVVFQGRSIHVAAWARRFQFQAEQLNVPVRLLSGGERARLLLAKMMLEPADVLLLDEPTNDLDIETLENLEQSLEEFPGAIGLVTHDRYMLERLCDIFVGLTGEGESRLYASYEQWEREFVAAQKSAKRDKGTKDTAVADGPKQRGKSVKKLSYMEQREFDAMEGAIQKAESHLASCQMAVEDPGIQTSSLKLQEATRNLQDAEQAVESLYVRWAELEAKMDANADP